MSITRVITVLYAMGTPLANPLLEQPQMADVGPSVFPSAPLPPKDKRALLLPAVQR